MTDRISEGTWPALPPTVIGYDWPADGTDPFDLSPDDTQWVLYANRWGRAWPAGDFRDFGSLGDFAKRVPMGYKPILIYERLAIVDAGRVLRTWPETATPLATSSLARRSSPYSAVTQGAWRGLAEPGHLTCEAAVEAACAHTAENPETGPLMVIRTLRHESWH